MIADRIKDLPNTIEIDNNLNHDETIFTFTLLDINHQIVIDKFLVLDDNQPAMNNYFRTVKEQGLTGFYYICE